MLKNRFSYIQIGVSVLWRKIILTINFVYDSQIFSSVTFITDFYLKRMAQTADCVEMFISSSLQLG